MRYQAIIEAAIQAPSGDNCQPWRFEVAGPEIRLFNLPEKDTSLYNFRQRASLIAHGAALENMLIAARALGYDAVPAIFPSHNNEQHIATVTLKETKDQTESFYPQIAQRCTNRKLYDGGPLSSEERNSLLGLAGSSGLGALRLLEGSEKKELAQVICLNDRLVFENPRLHNFLFEHVRWSDEEAVETRDGLDIKTLELVPLDAFAFRLFRNYSLVQTLNYFGVSKIVAGSARKLAQSASAIGLITMPGSNQLDYLNAGRVLQRAWLEATRLGLSFQMMTGITFLMQRDLEGSATDDFSPANIRIIRQAYDKIVGLSLLKNETLAVVFRIGRCSPPSARSLRLSLDSVVSHSAARPED